MNTQPSRWSIPAPCTSSMAVRKAFALRISPELYEELRRWAEAEFRSVNGQVEFLLQDAVTRRNRDKKKRSRDSDPGSD